MSKTIPSIAFVGTIQGAKVVNVSDLHNMTSIVTLLEDETVSSVQEIGDLLYVATYGKLCIFNTSAFPSFLLVQNVTSSRTVQNFINI